jgi:phage-related protein
MPNLTRMRLLNYARSGILKMSKIVLKSVVWMGSSKKDLSAFPDEVKEVAGFALYLAQAGDKHPSAKPLKGFGGAGVLEVVEDHDGSTYRAVYTIKLKDVVYVLHAFQKKSKKGIATPKRDIELIKKRLRQAEELHARSTK